MIRTSGSHTNKVIFRRGGKEVGLKRETRRGMYIYYLHTLFIGKHYRLHRCDDQKHHNIDDFTKPTIIAWFSPRGHTLYGHTCPRGFTRGALFKGRI